MNKDLIIKELYTRLQETHKVMDTLTDDMLDYEGIVFDTLVSELATTEKLLIKIENHV